jgi:hypothetical protein
MAQSDLKARLRKDEKVIKELAQEIKDIKLKKGIICFLHVHHKTSGVHTLCCMRIQSTSNQAHFLTVYA